MEKTITLYSVNCDCGNEISVTETQNMVICQSCETLISLQDNYQEINEELYEITCECGEIIYIGEQQNEVVCPKCEEILDLNESSDTEENQEVKVQMETQEKVLEAKTTEQQNETTQQNDPCPYPVRINGEHVNCEYLSEVLELLEKQDGLGEYQYEVQDDIANVTLKDSDSNVVLYQFQLDTEWNLWSDQPIDLYENDKLNNSNTIDGEKKVTSENIESNISNATTQVIEQVEGATDKNITTEKVQNISNVPVHNETDKSKDLQIENQKEIEKSEEYFPMYYQGKKIPWWDATGFEILENWFGGVMKWMPVKDDNTKYQNTESETIVTVIDGYLYCNCDFGDKNEGAGYFD